MKRALLISTVGAALAGAVGGLSLGAIALAEVVQLGNLTVTIDGGIRPDRLPKKRLAPVTLHAEGHVRTDDSTTPPITERLVVDFDKNGTLDTKGLPTCRTSQLTNTLTEDALRRCRKALVGRGRTSAVIDYPDQEPFTASGPLLIFNGKPKGGKPTVIFHVYALVPLPTTFVVESRIVNAPGPRYGKQVAVDVPPISGGNGTLTDGILKVGKKWRHKGTKRSYLLAKCPTGRLRARGHVEWNDGRELDITITRPCKGIR